MTHLPIAFDSSISRPQSSHSQLWRIHQNRDVGVDVPEGSRLKIVLHLHISRNVAVFLIGHDNFSLCMNRKVRESVKRYNQLCVICTSLSEMYMDPACRTCIAIPEPASRSGFRLVLFTSVQEAETLHLFVNKMNLIIDLRRKGIKAGMKDR